MQEIIKRLEEERNGFETKIIKLDRIISEIKEFDPINSRQTIEPIMIAPKIKKLAEKPRFPKDWKKTISGKVEHQFDSNKKVVKKKGRGCPSKYPAAMENFVKKNIESNSNKELCGMVNDKWALEMNVPQLANYMFMRGLKRKPKKKEIAPSKPKVNLTKKYPGEMKEFVKDNIDEYSNPEMVVFINKQFDLDMTVSRFKDYIKYRNIKRSKNSTVKIVRKPRKNKYSEEVIQFLRDNVNNFKNRELAEMIGEKFNIKTKKTAVEQLLSVNKITRDEKSDLDQNIINFIKDSKQTDVHEIRDEIIIEFEVSISTGLIKKYMNKEEEDPKEEVKRIKQMRDQPADDWEDVDELGLDG